MRQSITTRYLGPTDKRGSRVVAECQARRIVVPWRDDLGSDENHDAAAHKLVCLLGWGGSWYVGAKHDGKGNVYVCADGAHAFTTVLASKPAAKSLEVRRSHNV
jgi:hypothetical protein